MNGILLLDKPSGMTSRSAGSRLARMFGAKTFGHLGTLDPMASGLLPVALGEATKMIPWLEGNEKEYEFEIEFGVKTDTDDITGQLLEKNDFTPSFTQIKKACEDLIGEYAQMPPDYSAKKVGGVPAYKLARAGKKPVLSPKIVKIYELEVMDPALKICRVRCSAGTFVRSLTRDIAEKCGAIATTSMIRRTKTNGFDIKNAVSLDFLENLYNNDPWSVAEHLKPIDFGLDDILVQNLSTNDAKLFSSGGFLTRKSFADSGLARVYSDEKFLGIGSFDNGVLKPKRLINVA